MKKQTKFSIDSIVDIVGIGLAIATLLGFLGWFYWGFDLLSHFRVQYFQLCLILIGIALWRRKNKRAVALILLACFNYAFVFPFYIDKPAPKPGMSSRVMLMNLNAGNKNADQAIDAIREANPDLLLLEEVTSAWIENLAVLNTNYPYRLAMPQEDCFGIMLLSKHPVDHKMVVKLGSADVPTIVANVHFPLGVITVVGTHPLPPISAEYSTHRDNQLAEVPYIVTKQKLPVLLMGDLNVSPFSYWFKRIISETGLKNSMKGFGFQPTWPVKNRFLRIPIDHVLHSPEIHIHNRTLGKAMGSDHLPVIVDFSLK